MTTDKPLRLHGVSRFTDDSHILLLHFNRRPIDDELREVHEYVVVCERLRQLRAEVGGMAKAVDAADIENERLRTELLEWKLRARNNGLMTEAEEREFMADQHD